MSNLKDDLDALLTQDHESFAATAETARAINADIIDSQRREIVRLRSDNLVLRKLASAEVELILAVTQWLIFNADELVIDSNRLDSLLEFGGDASLYVKLVADGSVTPRYLCGCRSLLCGVE